MTEKLSIACALLEYLYALSGGNCLSVIDVLTRVDMLLIFISLKNTKKQNYLHVRRKYEPSKFAVKRLRSNDGLCFVVMSLYSLRTQITSIHITVRRWFSSEIIFWRLLTLLHHAHGLQTEKSTKNSGKKKCRRKEMTHLIILSAMNMCVWNFCLCICVLLNVCAVQCTWMGNL